MPVALTTPITSLRSLKENLKLPQVILNITLLIENSLLLSLYQFMVSFQQKLKSQISLGMGKQSPLSQQHK